MQSVSLDHIDRKILGLLQTESGLNASAVGERIGLSQSACWRRIQRLREEGVIKDQPVVLDREKVGLTPGLTPTDEQISGSTPALAIVDAQPAIPVDMCIAARVCVCFLLAHEDSPAIDFIYCSESGRPSPVNFSMFSYLPLISR